MPLQASDIADLITTTQADLGRLKWTDLYTPLQEYVAMPSLMVKERVSFNSGTSISTNVMVGNSGNARNTGLYAADNTNAADIMKTTSIPWRHSTTSYLIENREVSMNREPARIVDMVKTRRADAMIALAELMEANFWGKPVDSNDTETPWGIDYWLVANATEGFNGGVPAGFSDVAGLDPAVYDKWRNWTAQYTDVTKIDLIRKMRQACTKTKFKSPIAQPNYNGPPKQGLYANYATIAAMEEVAEAQNDQLGNDLASKDGITLFRGMPLNYVPYLDSNAKNPVFGINWADFKTAILSGEFLRESAPKEAATSHNVLETFVDLSYNFMLRDRRSHFRIQTA